MKESTVAWLETARPQAIQGKFMWSGADSFSAPAPHLIPVELVWSRAFRGDKGFATVYDTEEEALQALRAGVERCRESGEEQT